MHDEKNHRRWRRPKRNLWRLDWVPGIPRLSLATRRYLSRCMFIYIIACARAPDVCLCVILYIWWGGQRKFTPFSYVYGRVNRRGTYMYLYLYNIRCIYKQTHPLRLAHCALLSTTKVQSKKIGA